MARETLVSRPLDKLNNRILGLKSIKEGLILTNGLSAEFCNNHSIKLQAAIDNYFMMGTALDEQRNLITTLEKEADSMSKKMLLGVINDFGDDSPHVSKVGGTPISERAKPISATEKANKQAKKAAKKA